jgi:hypothetical protein
VEKTLSDRRLTRVDGGCHDIDDDLSQPGLGTRNFHHLQDIDVPVLVESYGSHCRSTHDIVQLTCPFRVFHATFPLTSSAPRSVGSNRLASVRSWANKGIGGKDA